MDVECTRVFFPSVLGVREEVALASSFFHAFVGAGLSSGQLNPRARPFAIDFVVSASGPSLVRSELCRDILRRLQVLRERVSHSGLSFDDCLSDCLTEIIILSTDDIHALSSSSCQFVHCRSPVEMPHSINV